MEDVADVNIVKARENLSNWEDSASCLAPLTSEERDTIIELTSVTQFRPYPEGINENDDNSLGGKWYNRDDSVISNASENENNLPGHLAQLQLGNVKIESSQQFLTWFAGIEEGMGEEQDGHYRDYLTQLTKHRDECSSLLKELDQGLDNLQHLSDQYTSVSNKTSALHTDCEHLLAEQTKLSNKADTVESKLVYFKEVERISKKLSSPAFQVTSDSFIPLLAKIDECISYMNNNINYLEASLYLAKYQHCLSRALGMVKIYVTRSLESATHQVLPKPGQETPKTENASILYYGKFRANAPRIKSLMSEIEDRVEKSPEYLNLIGDCHQCYFSQRQLLLGPCVSDAVSQLSVKYNKDYCSLVRSGCAFLVHVCEDEYTLFHQFFSVFTPELDRFLQGLCTVLYDVLRPLVIHIDHLETLSELCHILRRGMIEEHIQNNPSQLGPLTNIVNQMLEDAQERLVYRAHIYIQTDIENYRPSPGDLAYPSKLQMMENIAENLASQRRISHHRNDSVASMTSIRSSTSEEVANITNLSDERFTRVGTSPADLHGMWYPTVRRTLMCLSKLYRCVDRSIFQGVSLEALAACMQSLSVASSSISKMATPLDGQLFEIKHLLILREQLASFQVDASLRETSLDWSKLREAAMGLVSKRGRLFSLTSNNSLLEFIVEGTPQVTEHILDSKRDVDNRLKKICEQLIFTCSEMLSGPLTSFIAKADVILQMNQNEQAIKPIVLKTQPFATPEKIGEAVTQTRKNIRTHVPSIQRSLELYLANKDTEFILFKPVRANVLTSFNKIEKILLENYTEEDRGIVAFPTQEEVSALLSSVFKS